MFSYKAVSEEEKPLQLPFQQHQFLDTVGPPYIGPIETF